MFTKEIKNELLQISVTGKLKENCAVAKDQELGAHGHYMTGLYVETGHLLARLPSGIENSLLNLVANDKWRLKI